MTTPVLAVVICILISDHFSFEVAACPERLPCAVPLRQILGGPSFSFLFFMNILLCLIHFSFVLSFFLSTFLSFRLPSFV